MADVNKITGLTQLQQAVIDKDVKKIKKLVYKGKSIFETGDGFYTSFTKKYHRVEDSSKYIYDNPLTLSLKTGLDTVGFLETDANIFKYLLLTKKKEDEGSLLSSLQVIINTGNAAAIEYFLSDKDFMKELHREKDGGKLRIADMLRYKNHEFIFSDLLGKGLFDNLFSKFTVARNNGSSRYAEPYENIINYAVKDEWQLDSIELLLNRIKKENIIITYKKNTFLEVIKQGNNELLEILMKNNFFPDDLDSFEKIENPEMMKTVLKYYPEVFLLSNEDGSNLLDIAIKNKNNELISFLQGFDCFEKANDQIKENQDQENLSELFDILNNEDLNNENKIALSKPLINQSPDLIDQLFNSEKKVLEILSQDNYGFKLEIIEFLLDNLQDKNLINKKCEHKGTNLLFEFIKVKVSDIQESRFDDGFYRRDMDDLCVSVGLMIDAGADVSAKDKYGWTILDKLSNAGDDDSPLVKLLLINGAEYNKQFSSKFNGVQFKQAKRKGLQGKEASKRHSFDIKRATVKKS